MQALTPEQIKELRAMIDCLPVDGVKRRGLMVSRFNASGIARLRDICHCGLGYGQPDESEKYAALIASMLSNALALIDAAERAEKYEKALQDIATSPEPDASLSDAEKAAMTDCEACARVQARGPGEWMTMCPACYERIRRRDERTKEMRQMWAWGLKVKASSALSNPPAQGETR